MPTHVEQQVIDTLNDKTKNFRIHVNEHPLINGLREVPSQHVIEYVKNFCGLLANSPALTTSSNLIPMDLSRIRFKDPIEFPEGNYPAFTAADSYFASEATFNKIRFLGDANFSGCSTAKSISFGNASFTLGAFFQSAKLLEGGFSNVTFHKGGNFESCQFSFISNNSMFKDKVIFIAAPSLVIEDAQFEGAVMAHDGGSTTTKIKRSQFQQPVAFEGTSFTTSVIFEDCQFSAKLSFEGRTFVKDVTFRRIIFNEANFNNTVFRAPTDFEGSTFNCAPQFFGARLFPDTSFTRTTFTNFSGEREAAAYRELRHLGHDILKSSIVESEFFAREQRALSNSQIRQKGRRLQGWMSKAYDYFSEYGQSISKPLVWWAAVNGSFAVIFCFMRADIGLNKELVWNYKVWPAAGLMFQNIVAPFVFFGRQSAYFPTSGCVALLSVSQSILSFIFLALMFLAIRRRFRKGSE